MSSKTTATETDRSASQEFDVATARRRCVKLRKRILEMSQKVSALHIAGAYSCLEIVDTIYSGLMRRGEKVENPDSFILSKGHGSLAQYTVLEELGVLSREEMELYCKPGGRLGTHPDIGVSGIEASTGSLGHGLGLALGMALADRVAGVDRTVFVVMSDGEMQEGSVWEALMLAPSLKVNKIIGFVDLNDFQSLGQTSKILPNFYPLTDKIRAFGWEVAEVDGHNQKEIFEAVMSRKEDSPLIVVSKTTKGKGVSFMENVPIWHYRSPSPEEYQIALKELSRSEK